MNDARLGPFSVAIALLFVLTASANATVAWIYSRGATRVRAAASIEERDLRILSRPLILTVGQQFAQRDLEAHLDRIGYYRLDECDRGCYRSSGDSLTVWPRYAEHPNVTMRWSGEFVASIVASPGEALASATIEPDTIATFAVDDTGTLSRTSIDYVPFAALRESPLIDAIVASEDRAFYQHHGIDFLRLTLVPFYGGGASTITMQVARLNVLQSRRRTLARKANELGVAMVLERLHSKDAILAAYANTVDLGARRGRPVHGFGAAAREFFGVRDVRALSALQAATLVALLNQPSRYLDALRDGADGRLLRQRNRVLRLMQRRFPERYTSTWLRMMETQPVSFSMPPPAADDLHTLSRHFLDYALPAIGGMPQGRAYLTLDAHIQKLAVDALERGLTRLEGKLSAASHQRLEGAILAIDPASGDVLAMVGGRSYERSQFNRSVDARRQIGSIMKPFDYLAAFERAADEGRQDVSQEMSIVDQPTLFRFAGIAPWRPANYDHNYAGTITWRRALAESRNVPAVKVAAWAGFKRVSALWQAASGQTLPSVFPSIALGAIQATPAEVAAAYMVFAKEGITRPLRAISRVISAGEVLEVSVPVSRRVARRESADAVRDMMRAVFDEGTARGARAAGFELDAAGKTGTTDALRDAWFAGFTRELLTVVWVGRDDDRPVGFTGAEAALPIWTDFMSHALDRDR
jgi:membrane peptidoglycan carboxypeptidase